MPLFPRISDLMDLDYLLRQAKSETNSTVMPDTRATDRAIFLAYAKTHPPPFDRKGLIRYWLHEKRAAFSKNRPLPGALYNETMGLLRTLFAVAAFFLGAILAWSVLSYSGTTPINIFTCIWVMVAPQLALLALLGLSVVLSRLGVSNAFKGVYSVAFMLLRRLSERVKTTGQDSLSGRTRLRLSALVDLANRQTMLYGLIFFWPVFILAQLFGVGFNLGLLAATGLKLAITDLAFGWQSTFYPDPETVNRILDVFSLPWSWVVSFAHPSITQIEGSRMILKEGVIHLATPDLVSWWPFLVYAILCYGLVPRLVLLAWGGWQQHRSLGKIGFSTGACDLLIQRMQAPRLQSRGMGETEKISKQETALFPDSEPALSDVIKGGPMGQAIVLVPEEIAHFFPDEEMKDRVATGLGLDMAGRLSMEQNTAIDIEAINGFFSQKAAPLNDLRLVVLTEAWQPPLRETIAWLADLRRAAGSQTGLIVGLVGKPEADDFFTAPAPIDRNVWEQAVVGLKDPFVRVENLGGSHG